MGRRVGPEPVGILFQVRDAAFFAVLSQLRRGTFARGILMKLLQTPPFVLGMLVEERFVGTGKPDCPGFRGRPHVPRTRSERSGFFFHKSP